VAVEKKGLAVAPQLPARQVFASVSPFVCRRLEMKPETNSLVSLAFFLIVTPLAFSQSGAVQPCPDVRPGTLGCELIEWSRLQEPVPLPEPDAKPVPPKDQPDALPGRSKSSTAPPQASRQVIVGTIVSEGKDCVLTNTGAQGGTTVPPSR
jgi:hypothetical protein